MKRKLGDHIICEAELCDVDILNNDIEMTNIMLMSAIKSGAGVLGHITHKFTPQGVTVVVGLSESHVTIHSWPETGEATVDCYTCGDKVNTRKMIDMIVEGIKSKKYHIKKFDRGVPKDNNEGYETIEVNNEQ